MPRAVIIGFGNTLRRDDAAGPHVAGKLESRLGDIASVLMPFQLLPEHAADLAEAELVVFIDAAHSRGKEVQVSRVAPATESSGLGHSLMPDQLLALTQAVYGRAPEAWQVLIPGEDFEHGEGFSKFTESRLPEAEAAVLRIFSGNA